MGDHRLPERSCRESWRTRNNMGRGQERRRRTAWQRIVRRSFGIAGDGTTAALDPGFWYSTVCEGGYRFMAEWVRDEEKATENR